MKREKFTYKPSQTEVKCLHINFVQNNERCKFYIETLIHSSYKDLYVNFVHNSKKWQTYIETPIEPSCKGLYVNFVQNSKKWQIYTDSSYKGLYVKHKGVDVYHCDD